MPTRVVSNIAELAGLVGSEIGVSGWVEVTQEKIDRFADLTGDRQWIHIDRERAAAESPFGTTIAHGFLTLSLLSAMIQDAVRFESLARLTVNYGFNRVRFPSPVPAGARVRARVSVNSVRAVENGTEIVWGVLVEIENHPKPAIAAEWVTRMMGAGC